MPRIPPPEERPRIVDRLRRMVRRWPQVSGYHLNPDPEVVEGIVQALVRSTMAHGQPYCPCRDVSGDAAQDRRIICPCEYHHREIREDGYCRCQLFVGDNYDPETAYQPEVSDAQVPAVRAVRHRWVTAYTTNWCFHSRRTRNLLEQYGVDYANVDIEQDEEAARRVEAWNGGFRSVPTLVARLVLVEPASDELRRVLDTPGAHLEACTAYITHWCPQSRRTMAWIAEQGMACEQHDIEADREAAAQVREWTGGLESVPTLDLTLRVTEPPTATVLQLLGLG